MDAKDTMGAWLPARVVDVFHDSIRVAFERYDEKWDETYPHTSENLAPFATRSQPMDTSVHTIPVCHKHKETGDVIGQPFLISIGSWYTFDEFQKIIRARLKAFSRSHFTITL
jgi:hypothetical protein